jgi:membrane protein DedA with SNARE-associated domain
MPGVRTFVSVPAGFAEMPRATFLVFSALGTTIWTTALAHAGVLLRSNYALVGDYINVVTSVLLAGLAVALVARYIRCWKSPKPS